MLSPRRWNGSDQKAEMRSMFLLNNIWDTEPRMFEMKLPERWRQWLVKQVVIYHLLTVVVLLGLVGKQNVLVKRWLIVAQQWLKYSIMEKKKIPMHNLLMFTLLFLWYVVFKLSVNSVSRLLTRAWKLAAETVLKYCRNNWNLTKRARKKNQMLLINTPRS